MLRTGGGGGGAGESSVTETRKVKKPRASRRITPRVIKLCAAYLWRSTPRARKGVTDTREKAAGDGKAGNWWRETGALWVERGENIMGGYTYEEKVKSRRTGAKSRRMPNKKIKAE